jgi:CheY-like chemotaxis protein/HPt (histidine-containing phosphotransfer) domain-containing protein
VDGRDEAGPGRSANDHAAVRRDRTGTGLDRSVIKGLLEIAGPKLVRELATLSSEKIARCMADLDRGFSEGDPLGVRGSAHAIAAASAAIGATGLAEVAGTVERLAEAGDLDSADALRAELSESWMRARHALQAQSTRGTGEPHNVLGGALPARRAAAVVDVRAPLRALVVDDAPATRRFVRATLKTVMSIEVVGEASSGQQAVELARRLRPDLVLLDLLLPGDNGADVLRDLRRAAPAARVVVLSNEVPSSGPALLVAGAVGYIPKGLGADELIDRLSAAIGVPLLVSPQHSTVATKRVEPARAVVFVADRGARRTVNDVLSESGVQTITEVIATGDLDVVCAAVRLVHPNLVIVGDVPRASGLQLVLRLRQLVPDAVLVRYASEQTLDDAEAGPWVLAVPRGDVNKLTSCVRSLLSARR